MEASGYEEQLYLMLKATRRIAERAYWAASASPQCGADVTPECEPCGHHEVCMATRAADEAEAKLKAWNITTE